MSEDQTVKLKVVGDNTIHCSGCERTVEFTISHMPGVEKVKADHKTQAIEFVLTSGETDLEKFKGSLEWIGYQVEVT
jgi:copper chaperone CopZ